MQLLIDKNTSKNPYIRYSIYFALAILFSIFNISILRFIDVAGITPDLLLIMVIWITLAEGQFVGLFAGFGAGLIFDFITLDVIGTNALAKVTAVFIAGFFYKEGKEALTLGKFKFISIVFGTSIVHNLLYFFFYLKTSDVSFINFFLKYGLAMSFYTAVLSSLAVLINLPKREIIR